MTEYTQSFQPEKDRATPFDNGDEVNLHAAQVVDTYQVGHDRAIAAKLAEQARASMERPLERHEEVARISQLLEDFRRWEAELAGHLSQASSDDYELTNS